MAVLLTVFLSQLTVFLSLHGVQPLHYQTQYLGGVPITTYCIPITTYFGVQPLHFSGGPGCQNTASVTAAKGREFNFFGDRTNFSEVSALAYSLYTITAN